MKWILSKSMWINLFVGQQVCKPAHTHTSSHSCLCSYVTSIHCTDGFIYIFLSRVQPCTNQFQIIEAAPHLAINSSSVSSLTSAMSLRTVAHRNMLMTRHYSCYCGKTNSFHGEKCYRYIANGTTSPISSGHWCTLFLWLFVCLKSEMSSCNHPLCHFKPYLCNRKDVF